jgi:hypothetical protein
MLLLLVGCGPVETDSEQAEVVDYDADDDGVPDSDDCAPQDPTLWEDRILEGLVELEDLNSVCLGACSLQVQDIDLQAPLGLEGLSCLTHVEGDFKITGLADAQDLSGLERLEEVGGTLSFVTGSSASLSGLDSLRSVSNLTMNQFRVPSLEGLSALRSVQTLDVGASGAMWGRPSS